MLIWVALKTSVLLNGCLNYIEQGRIGVTVSQGTEILVDPDIAPANELRRKITTPSLGKPNKMFLASDALRTIRDIENAVSKSTTGYNLCRTSVQQVCEDKDCECSYCKTCRRKVSPIGADYWCFRCNAEETNPSEKLKLHIQVSDKHGLFDGAVFSDTASGLLDMGLTQINDLNKNASRFLL